MKLKIGSYKNSLNKLKNKEIKEKNKGINVTKVSLIIILVKKTFHL